MFLIEERGGIRTYRGYCSANWLERVYAVRSCTRVVWPMMITLKDLPEAQLSLLNQ